MSETNTSRSVYKADLIIFVAQVLLLFIVVVTSLVNLSLENGNTNLWTMVLTSSIGIMLPNPRLKVGNDTKALPFIDELKADNGIVLRDAALKRQVVDNERPSKL